MGFMIIISMWSKEHNPSEKFIARKYLVFLSLPSTQNTPCSNHHVFSPLPSIIIPSLSPSPLNLLLSNNRTEATFHLNKDQSSKKEKESRRRVEPEDGFNQEEETLPFILQSVLWVKLWKGFLFFDPKGLIYQSLLFSLLGNRSIMVRLFARSSNIYIYK